MMNNSLTKLFIFTAGVAVGSIVTWKYIKTKYEQIAQDEIDSVKDMYSYRYADHEEPEEEEYRDILSRNGYVEDTIVNKKEEENMNGPEIEVIPPDEFGDIEDYEVITLYHYADGVLTDDLDEPVDDIENTVGEDYADHFGEWEDDSVFVRNDAMRSYFEILLKVDNYNEE